MRALVLVALLIPCLAHAAGFTVTSGGSSPNAWPFTLTVPDGGSGSPQKPLSVALPANTSTTGSISSLGGSVTMVVSTGCSSIGLQVTGAWTGTIAFWGTLDSLTFVPIVGTNGTATGSSITTNGLYEIPCGWYSALTVISTAWSPFDASQGVATITMQTSTGASNPGPLPSGTNEIGTVSTHRLACDAGECPTGESAHPYYHVSIGYDGGQGSLANPMKVDQTTFINTMACACTTATPYGDGGTLGATTTVDAGAANIPILPYGETALYVGSNSDITIARDAPCVAYASGGSTASIPSGGWPWYVPLPNNDAGFTTTYYNVCSQSGTTRVCLCPRSAVAP